MSRLPDPIFNDSLDPGSTTLAWSEAAILAALGLGSIAVALVVTCAASVKFVYGLPGATLQFALKTLTARA